MFFFSSDILEKVKQATDYNRKKVQEFMLDLIKLMLVGHEAEMAYYKFNIPYVLENTKGSGHIRSVSCAEPWKKQIGKWREIIPLELWPLLRYKNRGQSNQALAKKIYKNI